jgi:hypothetical protein
VCVLRRRFSSALSVSGKMRSVSDLSSVMHTNIVASAFGKVARIFTENFELVPQFGQSGSESRTSPWKRVHQGHCLRKVSSNLLTISRRFEIRAL